MFGKAEFVRANKPLTAFSAVVTIALALGGCNDIAAQHAVPVRPVLVTGVHYEADDVHYSSLVMVEVVTCSARQNLFGQTKL